VVCIEDFHEQGSDVDFNDIIFSITDNENAQEISRFVPPKWAIGKKMEDGSLIIEETKDLLEKNKP